MVVSIAHPPGAELCRDWATQLWGQEEGSKVSLAVRSVLVAPAGRSRPAPTALAWAWPRCAQQDCLKGWTGRRGVEEEAAMESPLHGFPLPPR